jgi:transposase
MENEPQAVLFADVHLWRPAEAETVEAPSAAGDRQPRLQLVNRNQLLWRAVDVEQLVGPDHPARAIWELMGQRDLSLFYGRVDAIEGVAGRGARDPRLLLSLWIYAYMEGIPSAREIARQCSFNPAFQWLTGATTVSAHSLSDFRTQNGDALKDLATQILALLAEEGMVDLQQVTLDGTKVRASAGSDTFRRQKTVERHLQEARQQIEKLNSGDCDGEEVSQESLRARQRGARERLIRLEKAQEELEKIQQLRTEKEKSEARVSLTDPEARIMKQNGSGYAPSYNVQLTTDAKNTLIVSVEVTQEGGDIGQLQPAMVRLQQESGKAPQQAIVDAGYTSRDNIVAMAKAGIDLIGPPLEAKVQKETLYQIRGVALEFRPEAFAYDADADAYTCPEGKILPYKSRNTMVGQVKYTYAAAAKDCAACAQKERCCPTTVQGRLLVRAEDTADVAAFRSKMETEEAKAAYKKRGAVAEFPNLWIKEKFGLRQFSVRGLEKVRTEARWVGLAYNIQQWIRLGWRKEPVTASATV